MAYAERTGAVPPGSNWTTIPGLQKSITLTQRSLVQIAGSGLQRLESTASSCQVGYRLVIDGVGKGDPNWGQRLQTSTAGVPHQQWSIHDSILMEAGSHTIALQAITTSLACYVCSEHNGTLTAYDFCSMNIVAAPQ